MQQEEWGWGRETDPWANISRDWGDSEADPPSPKRLTPGDRVLNYVRSRKLQVSSSYTSSTSVVTVFGHTVDVLITCDAAEVDRWIARQTGPAFGVDLEWRPNFERGGEENRVALLQISTQTECLIVQMLFMGETMPTKLVSFLRDSQSMLGGVGIKQDAQKLMRDYNLKCEGAVELGALAVERLAEPELRNSSLKSLARKVMGFKMDKPKSVTLSNWASRHLMPHQVRYACVDAWVSFAVLDKLLSTIPPPPPAPPTGDEVSLAEKMAVVVAA